MLCLRCELAAKLERESKAKTKGLADIQRYRELFFISLSSEKASHIFSVASYSQLCNVLLPFTS